MTVLEIYIYSCNMYSQEMWCGIVHVNEAIKEMRLQSCVTLLDNSPSVEFEGEGVL